MDDGRYLQLAREVAVGVASPDDVRALATEGERRGELRFQVLAALATDDDVRASELAESAGDDEIAAIVETLARWGTDHAWHGLFDIAEASPDRLALVEEAVTGWSDDLRVMPRAWWSEIEEGEHHAYHRLARSNVFEGDEVRVLELPGARESLRHLTQVQLRLAGDDELAALAHAGLDRIRELQVVDSCLSCAGVADVVVAPAFPSLETLAFIGIEVDPPSVAPRPMPLEDLAGALAGRETRRARFDLLLIGLGVDAAGMRAFGAQAALRGIGTICFGDSDVGSDEIAILATSEHARELTGLALRAGGMVGEAGARALAAAPFARHLQVLELFEQRTTDAIADVLARIEPGTARLLELRGNELGPRTARVLGAADLSGLRQLSLNDNPLSDEDLAHIVRNPTLRSLEVLEMLGTGAGEDTARALAEAEHLTALRVLSAGDHFGDGAAAILGGARALDSVEHLGLAGVSDAALRALQAAREGMVQRP